VLKGINALVRQVGHSFTRSPNSQAVKIVDYLIDSDSIYGE
jgi:hypothetical protein